MARAIKLPFLIVFLAPVLLTHLVLGLLELLFYIAVFLVKAIVWVVRSILSAMLMIGGGVAGIGVLNVIPTSWELWKRYPNGGLIERLSWDQQALGQEWVDLYFQTVVINAPWILGISVGFALLGVWVIAAFAWVEVKEDQQRQAEQAAREHYRTSREEDARAAAREAAEAASRANAEAAARLRSEQEREAAAERRRGRLSYLEGQVRSRWADFELTRDWSGKSSPETLRAQFRQAAFSSLDANDRDILRDTRDAVVMDVMGNPNTLPSPSRS